MVRAKFTCIGKQEKPDGGCEITLAPVTCGSAENENFYKYTPWGEVKLGTVNEAAAAEFVVGQACYVDFTQCLPGTCSL